MDERVARFEHLILPHLDAAYTFARYLLRDEHDAQDAVQDASLRAYRSLDQLRSPDPRAWFLVIVRNSCLTWRRKRRLDEQRTVPSEGDDSGSIEPTTADAIAVADSDMAAIQRAVAALPVEFQEVIILRELEDLSYAEISEVVGIPIGTVMSRLARARRTLAQRLGPFFREVG